MAAIVEPLMPPAIMTLPLVFGFDPVLSCVAACENRPPVPRPPVGDQVFVAGSNRSAVLSPVVLVPLVRPPTTSTFPVDSSVAVWSWRADAMLLLDDVHFGSRIAG